jgi:hypothetical protein
VAASWCKFNHTTPLTAQSRRQPSKQPGSEPTTARRWMQRLLGAHDCAFASPRPGAAAAEEPGDAPAAPVPAEAAATEAALVGTASNATRSKEIPCRWCATCGQQTHIRYEQHQHASKRDVIAPRREQQGAGRHHGHARTETERPHENRTETEDDTK